MRLIVVARLSDHKLLSKLAPLLALEQVEQICLVRRTPLAHESIHNYNPPAWMRGLAPLAELYRIMALAWLCLFWRPDALIGVYFVPHGLYAGLAGKLFGRKTIQLLTGSDLQAIQRSRVYQAILGWADLIGVRGRHSRELLLAQGFEPAQLFIPPNVFEVEHFEPEEGQERPYDLIFIGSLTEVKRPGLLVEALALLKRLHPDIRLAMLGDGYLRPQMEEQAGRLGLADNLQLCGSVPAAEIPNYLNQACLLVLPSRSEGLPMVLVEALSCGLPVVATAVNDVVEVAQHGVNAWLLNEPVSAESLAEAIAGVLDDQELYDKLRAGALASRQRFAEEYSLEHVKAIWAGALGVSS